MCTFIQKVFRPIFRFMPSYRRYCSAPPEIQEAICPSDVLPTTWIEQQIYKVYDHLCSLAMAIDRKLRNV